LTVLLLLSRITAARAAFILAALVVSFAEPAYLPDPEAAIRAALLNALALAGTAWVVAAVRAAFAPPATPEEAPAPPGRDELVRFALLVLTAIGLQMLFYNRSTCPKSARGSSRSCSPPIPICGRFGGGCRCASSALRAPPRSPC
jgi:hypothetical protein